MLSWRFPRCAQFRGESSPAGWSIITSPSTSVTQRDYLNSVTCASASDCWAVGYYYTASNIQQTLITHWDGTSWTIVTSPGVAGGALNSVACASASECWAVGHGGSQTLIEHWDGTSWILAASPNNGALGNTLGGVTCVSTSDCWAAGYYFVADSLGDQIPHTLVEHWNGASWSIVSSPNNNPIGTNCGLLDECRNFFQAVTCVSASDCWAVGLWGNTAQTLIEHWDGSSWSIVTLPDTSSTGINDVLNGVTCASASDCWAVGESDDGEGDFQTLIEHWDGSSWAIVPSPNPSTVSALSGVACVSASECWAVGFDGNGNANPAFVQQWNGSSWLTVTSPNTPGTLHGVTCPSASQCWAVGNTITGSTTQTLIEEYAPTIPPLTSVVSRKVHGSAGTFDINLPLIGTHGVECRTGGANGNYQMVFSFVNNVTSCGTASIGSLSSGPGSNQCTVNLTGVANQQNLTVTLNNVLDTQNNTGNVSATMGVLIGDTTGNGSVNASDISQTKAQSGTAATATNFRTDVTVNGSINSSDISTVKSKSGTALP